MKNIFITLIALIVTTTSFAHKGSIESKRNEKVTTTSEPNRQSLLVQNQQLF